MTPDAPDGPTAEGRDPGGWRSTAAQGFLVTRWAAGELAALWVTRMARWAWIGAGVAAVLFVLSIPVDPGWPLVALGAAVLVGAVAFRLSLAVVAALLRRAALPRRARHLRADAAAARHRLLASLQESGVPVSIGHVVGFLWALVRGRRPHARVTGDLRGLTSRLVGAAEVDHLRDRLAEAAGEAPAAPPEAPGDGLPGPTDH